MSVLSVGTGETKAMETYIGDSLPAGFIHLYSFLAGAGFFFVEKKDKTLRPCIDYRGLNDITVKKLLPATTNFLSLQAAPGGHDLLQAG